MVTLTIDGIKVETEENTTILQAAKKLGIDIPTLCYDKRLGHFGACRICIVEVDGKLQPACLTYVREGIEVITSSPKIRDIRRFLLHLLLLHHPLDCTKCDKAGNCELQNLTYLYEIKDNPYRKEASLPTPSIKTPSLIEYNPKRCILCGKCVRICEELQGIGEISFISRGMETYIGTDFNRPIECEFCGQCLDACPTGALLPSLFKYQFREWELIKKVGICHWCSCLCRLNVHINKKGFIKKIRGDFESPNEGNLCVRGRWGWTYLYSEDRIVQPRLNKPSPKEITWAEAFALLEKKLKETPQKKQGIIYSPNLTNEELELLVYLALNLIKTDKLDTLMSCSHPFYSLIREAVAPLSIIKERAEVVFLLRNNPQQANPLLKTYLNYALRQRKINIIYAYPTEINFLTRGWKLAPLSPKPLNLVYLPYRELLAVAGILKSLLKYTEDKEEKILNLQEHLKTNFSWEFIENKSGVKKDELEDVANILVKNEKIALVIGASYGLLSDEENLAYAIYYLVYILKKVLKKEVNLFYLTDKPNLWGMIEAGASPYSLKEGSIKRLRMNVYQILNAGVKGELELLYIIGENISNYPGVIRLMEELKSKVEFIVYQGSFQNPTSAIAHLILPTTQFLETEGTFLDYSIQPVKFNSCVLSNSGRMSNESIFRELIRRYGGQVAEKEDKREYSEELDLLFSFRDTFVCEADNFYPFYLFPGPYLFFSDSPWEKNFSLVEKLIASPFFEVSKEIESKLKIKERTKVKLISPFGEISNIELRYSNDIPPNIVYLPYYFGASQLLSLPSLDFSPLPLFYGNKVRIST